MNKTRSNGEGVAPGKGEIPPEFDLTIKGTGEVLKLLRDEKKLTQEQVAQRAGCLKSDLARYERNQVGISFSRLVAIAEALGLTPDELLTKCLEYAANIKQVNLPTYTRVKNAGEKGKARE